ncbi:MAG: M18 family aminopeptidase [Atopobiaceae bacterium]|jgi:aspartyl aminopeptidase
MQQSVQENGTGAPQEISQELIEFIHQSPSMFHSVKTIRSYLDAAQFTYLPEGDAWHIEPGKNYYTTRNDSSVIAWKTGRALDHYHFQIAAAHADSPTFKVKSVPELEGPENYLRLNVEAYGGMLDRTWFDRPLSVAGRVIVKDGAQLVSHLVAPDKDVALIPSVAIHFDRDANKGVATNRQVDLCPLISAGKLTRGDFVRLIAHELGKDAQDILGFDLFLVSREHGRIWGFEQEFVSAPKLDDLQCAFCALKALLESTNDHDVSIFACFDNEEVGSLTKQGAQSTFLSDVTHRINAALGKTDEDFMRAVASSFMVSCDNAHAVHPNHPEKTDAENKSHINGGVVIKEAANQLYTTDAVSRAVFKALCDKVQVPTQSFANRSDTRGGSTLGNLSNLQLSVRAVDMGLPQLAMHSSYETAGVEDTAAGIAALKSFFTTTVDFDETGTAHLI